MNYIIRCDRQDPLVQWYCTDRDEDREPIGIVNGITADQSPPGAGYWMTTYRVTATQVWEEPNIVGYRATATVIYKNSALATLIAELGDDEVIWKRAERQATLRVMDQIRANTLHVDGLPLLLIPAEMGA